MEEYDISYHIQDELVLLSHKYSNDVGLDRVPYGGTVNSAEEHPDVIIERNLKDTALYESMETLWKILEIVTNREKYKFGKY